MILFKPAARFPADPRAIFILAVSVFSAMTALAFEVAPGSLEELLPTWVVVLWATLLGLGSIITLAGMASQTVAGIIAEQVGSVMVGATTVFYSAIVLWIAPEAVQSLGIILAWGLACFIRWAQLQLLINRTVRETQDKHAVKQAEIEIRERAERERQQGVGS